MTGWTSGKALRVASSQWPAKNRGPLPTLLGELNSANNCMSLKADASPVEPLDETLPW